MLFEGQGNGLDAALSSRWEEKQQRGVEVDNVEEAAGSHALPEGTTMPTGYE